MPESPRRVALVTGASSGIGRAVALRLGAAGSDVLVHYRSGAERARQVADEIRAAGGRAEPVGADLADIDALRRFAAEIIRRTGRLDALVNNAGGVETRRPFAGTGFAEYEAILRLNLTAPFFLIQELLPALEAARGTVVNLSTALTRKAAASELAAYVSAKGGVEALTKALAGELGPRGVRLVCLAPGIVTTPLQERISTAERLAARTAHHPLGRLADPDDVAGMVAFLASPAAAFLNGETIFASGE